MSQNQEDREVLGTLAEFGSPERLLGAVRELRDLGLKKLDAHSPIPIHGMDEALGMRSSRLAQIALAAGIMGGVAALAGQYWTNAVDYPYLISGKPLFSLPANVPVTFEVIILSAAVATFLGAIVLGGLPKLWNPLQQSDVIRRATNDRFILIVDAEDGLYEQEATPESLERMGASRTEVILKDSATEGIPKIAWTIGAVVLTLAIIPPLLIAKARVTKSENPPLAWFPDMDYQPKFKSQTDNALFEDTRSMRPAIPGTVAWGKLELDQEFYVGIDATEPKTAADDQPVDGSPDDLPEPNWAEEIPIEISTETVARGRERYNIFCATCHGRAGDGNGPVSVRALELEQGTWVPPTSIHADHVRKQPNGKLFHTITNGVRKMPPYASQIEPEDRWAIVLYVRALSAHGRELHPTFPITRSRHCESCNNSPLSHAIAN